MLAFVLFCTLFPSGSSTDLWLSDDLLLRVAIINHRDRLNLMDIISSSLDPHSQLFVQQHTHRVKDLDPKRSLKCAVF